MKKYSKGILIGIGFIALSAILYYAHFLFFKDSHHIFIYLLGDIAFLPIEVLLVSVIFHKVIEDKDKKERLKKINMVLSVYFSEAGVELMEFFSREAGYSLIVSTDSMVYFCLLKTSSISIDRYLMITARITKTPKKPKTMTSIIEV